MSDINYFCISGRVIRDPVFRIVTNNHPYMYFTIANNRYRKIGGGKVKEMPSYMTVSCFDKLAETMNKWGFIKKGVYVTVDGTIQQWSKRATAGETFVKTFNQSFVAQHIILHTPAKEQKGILEEEDIIGEDFMEDESEEEILL